MQPIADVLVDWMPALVVAVAALAGVAGLRRLAPAAGPSAAFVRQVWTGLGGAAGFLFVLLALPLGDERRGQVLSLLGVVLSGTLALSATTFVGNALAGVLLRIVRSFDVGDFVRIEGQFGRVSGKGLFHTEIQTEERDLTTLPNLYLVTHPVSVLRSSGTVVSAQVSLGYDVPRDVVEQALAEAATRAGLEHGFVQVVDLGDFAIGYRVGGLLTDLSHLLTKRSALRAAMIDVLHENGVEIASPTLMTTRALDPARRIAPARRPRASEPSTTSGPEAIVFDKAEQAQEEEEQRTRREAASVELAEREAAGDHEGAARLRAEIEAIDGARSRRAEP